MIVPHQSLSQDALQSLIEAHVLQEGTDYGGAEIDFRTKCEQVKALLLSQKACIVYDPNTNSADIRMKDSLNNLNDSDEEGHFVTDTPWSRG